MVGMPLKAQQMTAVSNQSSSELIVISHSFTLDCATHGNDGPTMELSSWEADDASLIRYLEPRQGPFER